MGSIYARGPVLWIAYKEVDGKRVAKATPFRLDGEDPEAARKRARALLDQIERDVKEGVPATTGPMTLRDWAERWTGKRERGRTEMQIFEKHAAPLLGMRLDAIRPRDIVAWVEGLKRTDAAPRTIWHRVSHLKTCFRVAELIPSTPCILPRGTLPARVDKDPTWREKAIYTKDDVIMLVGDERIPLRRRVVYALKALTGARHGEVQGLTWGAIDMTAAPLPKIVYAFQYDGRPTKTRATKIAPMHPTLGVILAAWKNAWPSLYGHEPTASDRVIGRIPDGKPEGSGTANPDLHADLRMLALRVRDGHDMRHTFISICMNAGALKHVVETITHPKAVVRDAFEAYVNVSYEDKCAAVLKVDIDPPAWALALAGRGDRAPELPASETAYADESEGQPASAVTTPPAQPCYSAATALANSAESCVSQPKTVLRSCVQRGTCRESAAIDWEFPQWFRGGMQLRNTVTERVEWGMLATVVVAQVLAAVDAEPVPADKAAHGAISYSLTMTGALLLEKLEVPRWQAVVIAGAATFAIGLGKELVDDDFSGGDLAADAVGVGLGAGVVLAFEL
jgi:integrase